MPELPDIELYLEALRERVAGRVLTRSSDRSLSRLLKDDWPKTVEELEPQGMP